MRKLLAKTGTYQKDGETKNEWTKIGVEMSNDNGPYLLLDPCVSLAGVLEKQNVLASSQGNQIRTSVMVSVFDEDQQSKPAQDSGSYMQGQPANQPAPVDGSFDDDIAF